MNVNLVYFMCLIDVVIIIIAVIVITNMNFTVEIPDKV